MFCTRCVQCRWSDFDRSATRTNHFSRNDASGAFLSCRQSARYRCTGQPCVAMRGTTMLRHQLIIARRAYWRADRVHPGEINRSGLCCWGGRARRLLLAGLDLRPDRSRSMRTVVRRCHDEAPIVRGAKILLGDVSTAARGEIRRSGRSIRRWAGRPGPNGGVPTMPARRCPSAAFHRPATPRAPDATTTTATNLAISEGTATGVPVDAAAPRIRPVATIQRRPPTGSAAI
jgi:hypothetical protein